MIVLPTDSVNADKSATLPLRTIRDIIRRSRQNENAAGRISTGCLRTEAGCSRVAQRT